MSGDPEGVLSLDPTHPRFRIAAARRMLHHGGCDSGVAGHVSERDGDHDAFWISPFGFFDETTPAMVQRYDFDLRLLDAGAGIDASPAIEFHRTLYAERPDVRSVVHTHSRWATTFSSRCEAIGMYEDAACLLDGRQLAWEDDPTAVKLVEGRRVVEALDGRAVLLAKNHGVIVAAGSLEEATVLALVVERAARSHIDAIAIGGTPHPQPMVDKLKRGYGTYYVKETWAAGLRRLHRSDPDLFAGIGGVAS